MEVGKAKYGNKKNSFKVKDGDNVYRILPALGDLAKKGKWSMYYSVEWGYKDTQNRNKPFQNCRVVNRETKMVEVESAAHLYREKLKQDKEKVIELFKQGKATREQVQEFNDLCLRYNCENKHYLNVVDLNGRIGLLKIGHKAKLALDATIKALRQQGVDPLAIENGLYFNFHRSQPENRSFRDIVVQVSVYKENVVVNGKVYEQNKTHTMDNAFISRLDDEAWELDKLYPAPTAEQVARMVKEGAVAVTQILGYNKVEEPVEENEEEHYQEPTNATVNAPQATQTVVTQQPVTTQPVTTTTPQPYVTTQPLVQQAPKTSVITEPTKMVSTGISDEEFLKSIGMMK